jgi:hypothetical protein
LTPITLAAHELYTAAHVGVMRRIESLKDGRQNQHGFSGENPWDVDIEGACAEIAAAKAINRYWEPGVNTFKSADIGTNIQVRATKGASHCLIVREADRDDHFYLLVTGVAPTFHVVGWIRGADAKRPAYLRDYNDRPAAYFVPQHALRPLSPKRKTGAR